MKLWPATKTIVSSYCISRLCSSYLCREFTQTNSQAKTAVSSLTANSPMIHVKPRRGRIMMKALTRSLHVHMYSPQCLVYCTTRIYSSCLNLCYIWGYIYIAHNRDEGPYICTYIHIYKRR